MYSTILYRNNEKFSILTMLKIPENSADNAEAVRNMKKRIAKEQSHITPHLSQEAHSWKI
jgi:hypothetical protein